MPLCAKCDQKEATIHFVIPMRISSNSIQKIVSVIGRFALLISVLALAGCTTGSDKVKSSIDRSWAVARQMVSASADYYEYQGHWPQSLNDLRLVLSRKGLDSDWEKKCEELINTIPWDELKDRTTFTQLPNGKLSISFPWLPDKNFPQAPNPIEVPITVIVDTPHKP